MSNPLTIGMLTNVITHGEQILDLLGLSEGEGANLDRLITRLKHLIEGDAFTKGLQVRELTALAVAGGRFAVFLKRLRGAEVTGGAP